MGKLIVHNNRITDKEKFIKVCPFNALEIVNGEVAVTSGCKMCKLCVRNSKNGEVEFVVHDLPKVDKSLWKGICVYVDHVLGNIHPVTYELIGKARELADKSGQQVCCVFIGDHILEKAKELLHYPVEDIYVYDAPQLKYFCPETYTAVFEDLINKVKPSSILVGATPVGRQLAPRVAARFRTGLTADCTVLDIEPNTDLVQIRPAFGGNIMAEIRTPNNRPQMATVRYKVMDASKRSSSMTGRINVCSLPEKSLSTSVEVLNVLSKEKVKSIEAADMIVVAGRGVKKKEDLALIQSLADSLGAEFACTRPLVEAGWVEARRQIGLSGRTVRPKLIITCGVSGAVQFTASMKSSDVIFAINDDPKAPIFDIAHYGVVGDLYEIVPKLTEKILATKAGK